MQYMIMWCTLRTMWLMVPMLYVLYTLCEQQQSRGNGWTCLNCTSTGLKPTTT
jgi:hypothetical protein